MSPQTIAAAKTPSPATSALVARANQIREEEMKRLLQATTGSARLYERAKRICPSGVVSSFRRWSRTRSISPMEREARSGTRTAEHTRTFTADLGPWWWVTRHPRICRGGA